MRHAEQFPYIVAFGRYMRLPEDEIVGTLAVAAFTQAPDDAYRRDPETGGWLRLSSLERANAGIWGAQLARKLHEYAGDPLDPSPEPLRRARAI